MLRQAQDTHNIHTRREDETTAFLQGGLRERGEGGLDYVQVRNKTPPPPSLLQAPPPDKITERFPKTGSGRIQRELLKQQCCGVSRARSYNALNGTPSCANSAYQNDLLRDTWVQKETPFFEPLSQSTKNRSFYQDRLGKNAGIVDGKGVLRRAGAPTSLVRKIEKQKKESAALLFRLRNFPDV